MMSPAICTALNSSWTTKPSAAPMTSSVTADTSRNPGVTAGSVAARCAETATESARANAALTGTAMLFELNGGAISTNPVARVVPRSRATRVASETCRFMPASGPAEEPRQLGEQALREGDHLVEHPVARDQERDRDG